MKTILFIEFFENSGSPNGLMSEIKFLNEKHANEYRIIITARDTSIFKLNILKLHYDFRAIKGIQLNYWYSNPLMTVLNYLITIIKIMRICIVDKVDIIHCYHYAWSIYACPVGLLLRIPILVHLKDVWLLQPKLSRILMKINPTTKYIAVSKYVKKLFINDYKISKKNITLVYDGIDDGIFSKISDENINKKNASTKKIITMMSSIDASKNVEIFIDAFKLLSDEYPGLYAYHYGFSLNTTNLNYFSDLKRRLKVYKLNEKFEFKSYLNNPNEVASILRKSYLTIVAAQKFALPNTAIESMMCATPVIALRTGGNPEIIQHENNGSLINICSGVSFALEVKKYLDGDYDYKNIAINASMHSRSRFSASTTFSKLISLYR